MNENDMAYLPALNRKYLDRLLTFSFSLGASFKQFAGKQMSSVRPPMLEDDFIFPIPSDIRTARGCFSNPECDLMDSESHFFELIPGLFIHFCNEHPEPRVH